MLLPLYEIQEILLAALYLENSFPCPTSPNCAAGLIKTFKGQLVKLLRHPCGSKVIDELYLRASGKQRTVMAAEFYGREMILFSQVLPDVLAFSLSVSRLTGCLGCLFEVLASPNIT